MARWCASLIVDQWPIPAWLNRRLVAHPDVAQALNRATSLERALRDDFRASPQLADLDMRASLNGHRRLQTVAIAALASAAALIICFSIWWTNYRENQSEQDIGPIAETIDTDPILASLAAGQTVAERVSSGLENVMADLADAGNKLASPFVKQNTEQEVPLD
ncbi:MAG: hypothetical protein AAGI63_03520 [Planctomycetota bacterium]